MHKADNYVFEIRDCRLTSLNFNINSNFVPDDEVQLDTNLALEHGILEEQNLLKFIMRLALGGEKAPFSISIEMGSIFYFPNGLTKNREIGKVAEINCASIVFPFLREAVADITRRAGLPPLMLPPFNFLEFYKNNHPTTPSKP